MTSLTVCVLTAGKGSRMGALGRKLNKALFPIDGKAIISHIIEKFPPGTEFVIGLGFLGEQVRQYLGIAHPRCTVRFVEVDNYDGPGSGPGYSLLCCRQLLRKPFYFVSCDTLWDDTWDWNGHDNWLGVSRIDPSESERYCNLKVVNHRITELRDKETITDPAFQAFVGLCHIVNFEVFWAALENTQPVAGEHQISNGIRALIQNTTMYAKSVQWTDVGDQEKYKKAVSRYENYDFSKENEALYIVNGNVIKFFVDPQVTQRRVEKAKLNQSVFPRITNYAGQFYAYNFQDGETLYHANNPTVFRNLLDWLAASLWRPHVVDSAVMAAIGTKFYHDKTLERLEMFGKKYPHLDERVPINGNRVPSAMELLNRVPWVDLAKGTPCFMHGDLQFDNILYDARTKSFTLLDWRQDFGGYIEFGDLYYDLAKLYGGIVLNYDYIKLNLLTYRESEHGVFFDFAQRFQSRCYLEILTEYIQQHGYDLARVRILVALIYLNMSPLHHYPFDKMLHALGRVQLSQELSERKRICA